MAERHLSPDEIDRLKAAQEAVLTADQRSRAEDARGELIRSLRAQNVGVTELARAVGLSRSHVNRIVRSLEDVQNAE